MLRWWGSGAGDGGITVRECDDPRYGSLVRSGVCLFLYHIEIREVRGRDGIKEWASMGTTRYVDCLCSIEVHVSGSC